MIDPMFKRYEYLLGEVQAIISVQQFFLPQPEISSRHVNTAMVEQFGKFNKSHFAVISRHLNDFTTEAFPKAVVAEMVDVLDLVLIFDFLQDHVQPLCTINGILLRNEAGRIDVPNLQCRITFTDVVLEVRVDFDSPLLLSLLLDDGECGIVEEHCPSQTLGIAYSKSEESSTSDV